MSPRNIPWLLECTESWPRVRAKFLFHDENRPVRDDDGVVTAFRDGQVTLRENRRTDGFTIAILEQGYQGVRVGDLVLHSMDAFAGAIGVSESDGKCTPEYVVVNGPSDRVENRYYAYLLRQMALRDYIRVICPSVRERAPRFRYPRFQEVLLPAPPVAVQRAFADFLDRKTAAVDNLIAKKERLLALLAEKRAALIHQAVTKGLDPNVPMKDSGVPWIGEIPAHWDVERLKFLVVESVAGPYGSSLTKSMYVQSGIRVYGQEQAGTNDFTVGDYYISSEKFASMRRYETYPGDLLVCVMGYGTVGKVAVVPEGIERGIINPRLVRYLPGGRADARFLRLSMMSDAGQVPLKEAAQGSTMPGLNMAILGDHRIALPPLAEQVEIRQAMRGLVEPYDSLSAKLELQLVKLREYRQAVITAAVSGQFDVNSTETHNFTTNKDEIKQPGLFGGAR